MMRNDIISLFKNKGFSIAIEANLIETTDPLDVTFNLLTGTYFPFGKSNHPNTIRKELHKMIKDSRTILQSRRI